MSKIEILGDRQLNESFGNYCFNLAGWKIRVIRHFVLFYASVLPEKKIRAN